MLVVEVVCYTGGMPYFGPQTNIDPRADWDRVIAIQSLIDKDETVEGSDSGEDHDNLDVSEIDSDSDQDLSSHEEDPCGRNEFKSKDGYTKWSKKPSKHSNKDSLKRKHISGCAGSADGLQTPVQAWSCLITESIIDIIIESTNEYIEKNHPAVGITGDMNENLTSRSEIKALFGILYLSGIMRPAFYHSSELWWGDGCGLSVVQMAMTLDRFRFLLKCIRFEDIKSRDYRLEPDKLSPIRQILEEFTLNCKQSYNLGECSVIDERIISFESDCCFRKSLQSKHYTKTGIKIYSLIETDTFYTSNLEVCVESKASGEITRLNAVSNVVSRLVCHLNGTGATIVTRDRLTTLKMANRLSEEYGLHLVGSLQSKRKEIPYVFSSKQNKNFSSFFGFDDTGTTLMSYIQPKRKACLLLSTRSDHYNTKKFTKSGAPEALVWYKQRRGSAAVAATLAASYTTAKRTSRWPLALFFHLLDISVINAQVLWMTNRTQSDIVFRRNFIRSLALELMNDHVKNNSLDDRPSFELDPLLAIRGGPIKNVASSDALLRRHRRCKLCPRNADRKTRSYCVACNTPACKEHYKPLCICCALKF